MRNPKDRSTIPELLDEDWLSMRECEFFVWLKRIEWWHIPNFLATLKEDETIINPHYMRQLLQYAIRCAQEGRYRMSEEEEIHEAEVIMSFSTNIDSP